MPWLIVLIVHCLADRDYRPGGEVDFALNGNPDKPSARLGFGAAIGSMLDNHELLQVRIGRRFGWSVGQRFCGSVRSF